MEHIVIAAQNETVRKHYDSSTQLATLGLSGCVGVLIKDNNLGTVY